MTSERFIRDVPCKVVFMEVSFVHTGVVVELPTFLSQGNMATLYDTIENHFRHLTAEVSGLKRSKGLLSVITFYFRERAYYRVKCSVKSRAR